MSGPLIARRILMAVAVLLAAFTAYLAVGVRACEPDGPCEWDSTLGVAASVVAVTFAAAASFASRKGRDNVLSAMLLLLIAVAGLIGWAAAFLLSVSNT